MGGGLVGTDLAPAFRHEHLFARCSEPPPTWDDLAARLVWARQEGYVTAKARRATGYVDRPLLPSEQMRLVEDATQLALH